MQYQPLKLWLHNKKLRVNSCILLISIIAVLLFGCTSRSEFMRSGSPIVSQQLFVNDINSLTTEQSMTRWWERLEDPLLNNYVNVLLTNNLSLKEATERVVQANEIFNIQRGGLFPKLSADSGIRRSLNSSNNTIMPAIPGVGRTTLNTELVVSWQIDLFGRIRRSVDVAKASFIASQYDREAIQQSLIADFLSRRVAIAINAELLALANEVSKNQESLYALVQRRYDLGARGAELVDVYLAEENLRSVQSDIHVFERQLTTESYRFDALLGNPPGRTIPNKSGFPLLPPPRDVAACLPIELLDRRPDLRASELRLAAADAAVGVSMADMYPGLNLGGTIGVSGGRISNLFTADQIAGALLFSITSRLFEGGALRANIRLHESEVRELSAQYAGDIIEALHEVETALKAEYELEKELLLQQQSVQAIRKAEEISQSRYRKGIDSLREYLETQQRRYHTEQNWLQLQQERWSNRISLYLALGGDWVSENEKTIYAEGSGCTENIKE